MSNLISGKEALIALANGEDVEVQYIGKKNWEDIKQNKFSLTIFDNNRYLFRIKPRTIKIEIEVPEPFVPKEGDMVWCLNELSEKGYEARTAYDADDFVSHIAYWRTEEEVKQVVEALRQAFNK